MSNKRACHCILLATLAFLVLCACHKGPEHEDSKVHLVQAVVVSSITVPNELAGFGVLSYSKKVDVCSPQEGVVTELPFREGDSISQGTVLARLYSPQLELSVGRARNVVDQAKAALALAQARIFEGCLSCESRSLGIEKSILELRQAERRLAEAERKQSDQERLYEAGGVTEEAIRSGRFVIESAKEELELLKKDIEIRSIGLRDEDLQAAGLLVPTEQSERQRVLNELSTATEKAEAAAASARVDAALKELESTRLSLDELSIVASMGGVLGARFVEVGERVKRDDTLFTIIDSSSLYAISSIDESQAIHLASGMKASVLVDAAGIRLDGILDYISPMADAQSASFSIRVSFVDPSRVARPGMFARVVITLSPSAEAITIPRTSIVDTLGDKARVFLLAGGMVIERSVPYEMRGEDIIVISGLEPGDVIIDSPYPGLKEGDRAEVSR